MRFLKIVDFSRSVEYKPTRLHNIASLAKDAGVGIGVQGQNAWDSLVEWCREVPGRIGAYQVFGRPVLCPPVGSLAGIRRSDIPLRSTGEPCTAVFSDSGPHRS
jgi:hypothetical protein